MNLYILLIEDEPDVLDALLRDLGAFEDTFPIETASSADEAREAISAVQHAGDEIGLIFCDHIMTGENGVDLLVDLQQKDFTRASRKVLVTAHAGLEDTIEAVNRADLAHYIAKPWSKEDLQKVARRELTTYILERKIDPKPYMGKLDPMQMAEAIRHGLMGDD